MTNLGLSKKVLCRRYESLPALGTFLIPLQSSLLVDATRSSDGSYVVLKRCARIDPSVVSGALREGQIFEKLFREPLASDPKNHCIRLIEILQVPDDPATDLIVMPLLTPWQFTHFPFVTIGEAVEFFSQIFEVGVVYIQKKRS
jgi:hypothetical protein